MDFSRQELEWVAISHSRGSSQPRDWTCISCIVRWILYHWTTKEAIHTCIYICVCVCVCVCVCILVYPGHIKKLEILNRKALIQIGLMLQYMKLFSRSKEQRAQYVNSYSPFHFLPCLLFILLCLLSGGVTGEARTRILFVNNWCFSVLKETVQKQLHAFPSGHTATPGPLLGRNSGASTAYL